MHIRPTALTRTLARTLALATTLVAVTTGPTHAQSSSGGAPPAEDFDTAKAQITAHLKEELACAEAASTTEALKACRPSPPQGPPSRQQ